MSRKLAILAAVSLGGLGLAAIVQAQIASQPAPPSLTDRLSQIRKNVVGETNGDASGNTNTDAAASEDAAQGAPRRMTDWSAGRKSQSPRSSKPKPSAETAANEKTPTSAAQRGPSSFLTPRTAKSATASAPAAKSPRTNTAPPAATPNVVRNKYVPERTAMAKPNGRPTPAPTVVNESPTAANDPSVVAPAAAPAAVDEQSAASRTAARSAPSVSPSASSSSTVSDSPLKQRLQALRDSRFEESVAPAEEASPHTAAPTEKMPEAAVAAPTETAVDQTTKPDTVAQAAPSGRYAAERYADDRPSDRVPPSANDSSAGSTSKSAAEALKSAIPRSDATKSDVAKPDTTIPAAKDTARAPAKAAAPAAVVNHSPVLSVRTAGPKKITVGKPATYQLTLENSGDMAANEVLVTVKLPAFAEIESAQASSGAARLPEAGGEAGMQWRVSRLEAGRKQTLTMQVVPRKSTPFQLGVQWTFVPEATQTVVEVQEPKLHLALTGPSEMLYGTTGVYRITLSNPGTGDAENVSVLTSNSTNAADGGNKLSIGTLAAGASKTLELKVAAVQAGVLLVRAQAAADGDLASGASEKVLVRRAGLKLQASGPDMKYAGTSAAYKVRVSNPGNATAENVRILATLPIGAKFEKCSAGGASADRGTKVEWTIASLAAGAEQEVDLVCLLATAGVNRLQVSATADSQLTDAAEVATKVEALADLKLEVSDPSGPVAVGENIVYEVRIRNRGTKTAHGVSVVGFFSEGVEPISATGGEHKIEPGAVTFAEIESIDPSQEVVCKITAKASQAGSHIFRAEMSCENPETRLVAEETTRFYGDSPSENAEPAAKSAATKDAAKGEDAGDANAGAAVCGNLVWERNAGDLAPPADESEEPRQFAAPE